MRAGLVLRLPASGIVGEVLRSRALSRLAADMKKPEAAIREPIHGRPWIDSERAVKCAEEDCGAIFEADGLPCPCPRCGNRTAVPIARALNRTEGWDARQA